MSSDKRFFDIPEVERKLGYVFKDKKILEEALTHASYAHELGLCCYNQRLEFLGDSVLNLVISHILYETYPAAEEGKLTKYRSKYVCTETLFKVALMLDIAPHLRVGKSLSIEDVVTNKKMLADMLEAIIGAIYLDGGLEGVFRFIKKIFWNFDFKEQKQQENPCAILNNVVQEVYRQQPVYTIDSVVGPPHAPEFSVHVSFAGRIWGKGKGRNKKKAKKLAAEDALKKLIQDLNGKISK